MEPDEIPQDVVYPFDSVNEYGTPITVLKCDTCNREFTVCPALPVDKYDDWKNCLADYCPSYDIERDVGIWIDAGLEHGLIGRQAVIKTTNSMGEWVPAIPLPMVISFGRVQCKCGNKYFTRSRYRKHYVHTHISCADFGRVWLN